MLGTAEKVTIEEDNTTGEKKSRRDAIADRVLHNQSADRKYNFRLRSREIARRLAKLAGGVAVLMGAASEVEMKERKTA